MKSKLVGKDTKVVVITGASSGIGKETSVLFATKGWIVVGLSRSATGENNYICDVTDSSQVYKVFEDIYLKYGRIDVLINNAGFGISGAVELISDEDIRREYDVNVLGVINCYKAAVRYMESGSKIINIASACALFPLPYRSLYCSSKAAVHELSLSLNMECKPFGVEVISVCPGDVKTNFTKNRVKIFDTNSRYGDRISNAAESIDSRENKRMPVTIISKKLYKISTKKHNKPFVIIGGKYKLLHFMMRFMPTSFLLHFTEKYFGGHKKKGE